MTCYLYTSAPEQSSQHGAWRMWQVLRDGCSRWRKFTPQKCRGPAHKLWAMNHGNKASSSPCKAAGSYEQDVSVKRK